MSQRGNKLHRHTKQQLQQIQGLGEMLQNKLTHDYQSIDWDRLRVTDPAEWSAKKYEFEQRQQELQQAGQMLGQQMRQRQDEQNMMEGQQRQQVIAVEREKMLEANPELGKRGQDEKRSQ